MIPCDLVPAERMPNGRSSLDKYEELYIRLRQLIDHEVMGQIAYVPFSTRDPQLQRRIRQWVAQFVHHRFPKMFTLRSTRDGVFIQKKPE